MKVTITQQHIDQGKPRQGSNCPVALALQNATGQLYHVGATNYWTKAEIGQPKLHALSTEAMAFIAQFDIGGPVSPCEIELDSQ